MFVSVWPTDGYAFIKAVSCKLASTQQQLYRAYRELVHGRLDNTDKRQAAHALRMQAIQQHARFIQLLEGAQKERYEVWEIRHKWESYSEQVAKLGETLEYWQESFTEIQELELQTLLPGLAEFDSEVDERLTQLCRMLADEAPTRTPQTIELVPDPEVEGYYRVKLRVNDGITDSKKVYSDWILIRE